jgi:two-component system nitrate/nitrite response regulator NarP
VNTTTLNGFSVDHQRLTALTDRQQQVATLACDGLFARELGLSEGTVKIHLHMIYKKLDVRSRADLMFPLATSRRVVI